LSKVIGTKLVASAMGATTSRSATVSVVRSDDPTQITWWKRLLYQERKRHGQVETILTRQIGQLEKQVDDLRRLYFSTITVATSPNAEKQPEINGPHTTYTKGQN
jgi:hypothetical protein